MGRARYEREVHGGLGFRWSDNKFWWEERAAASEEHLQWLEAMARGEVSPPPVDTLIYLAEDGPRVKYSYVLQLEHDWDGVEYVTAERTLLQSDFSALAESLRVILHPDQ